MLKSFLCIGALVLAMGCAAQPERPIAESVDMKGAEHGAFPSGYEELIKTWANENLKDPESVRFGKFSKPRKEFVVRDRQPHFGYSVCVVINAKNSYGGYVGSQLYWFFIRDGKIDRAQNTDGTIAGGLPGKTISRGHYVNCDDGNAEGM